MIGVKCWFRGRDCGVFVMAGVWVYECGRGIQDALGTLRF